MRGSRGLILLSIHRVVTLDLRRVHIYRRLQVQLPDAMNHHTRSSRLLAFGDSIIELARAIPTMSHEMRNSIIKCCQAQHFPFPDEPTALRRIAAPLVDHYSYTFYHNHRTQHLYLDNALQQYNNDPLMCGLILDLARSLPLPEEIVDEQRQKGWAKEMMACEGTRPDYAIDFSPIFDPTRHDVPLHPLLPPNRTMNQLFYLHLVQWRKWASTVTHYPRASNKQMSHETIREWENENGRSWRDEGKGMFDQGWYLRFLCDTGRPLGGASEMRQKWYPSGFKPRTYYAQGGVYFFSHHGQDLFTQLVNSSPITHHKSRLRPSRLYCLPGQRFRIYDLATFTSMMWEQRNFVDRLANFCLGYPMTIMTVENGLMVVDMGEWLAKYNEAANNFPTVTYRRNPYIFIDEHSYQCIAGMLGVFGNLMTCTFAHGVIMGQWVDDEDMVNVAGDDGIIPENDETEVAIQDTFGLMGSVEKSKTFDAREDGAICLKRPIKQYDQRLVTGAMIIWPNLATLDYLIHGIMDSRFQYIDQLSTDKRITSVGRELYRFLRSIHEGGFVNLTGWAQAVNYCHRIREEVRFALNGGHDIDVSLTQCGDRFFWPYIPERLEELSVHPWILACNYRYRNVVTLPLRDVLPFSGDLYCVSVGDSWMCNSDSQLSLLAKMRFLDRNQCTMSYFGEDGLERLKREILPTDPAVYTFTVLDPLPDWLCYY